MIKRTVTNLTPSEVKECIIEFMDANKNASKKGRPSLAVCFEAEAGIGKTSIPKQVAKERDAAFHYLVLSQIEDIGDLVGYPQLSYEICKKSDDKCDIDWANEKYLKIKEADGWSITGNTKTVYAPPMWLNILYEKDESILVIDDFTRADVRFQQAIMQLNQMGSYYSWSLPPNCTIVLTGNPDDGDYIVNAQDVAMTGRYAKFGVKFDINDWVKWATNMGVDGRCINIMAHGYRELLFEKDPKKRAAGKMAASPRDWSNFFEFISNHHKFEDPTSQAKILKYGRAFVGDHIDIFMTALTQNIDKIPDPEEILLSENWKTVEEKLLDCCGEEGNKSKQYRPEIGAVVSTRMQYFIIKWLNEGNKMNDVINSKTKETFEDRLAKVFEGKFLSKDSKTVMIQVLALEFGSKIIDLLHRKEFKASLLAAHSKDV